MKGVCLLVGTSDLFQGSQNHVIILVYGASDRWAQPPLFIRPVLGCQCGSSSARCTV